MSSHVLHDPVTQVSKQESEMLFPCEDVEHLCIRLANSIMFTHV